MGGRSGQGVVRNAAPEVIRQPALSDDNKKKHAKELGKKIQYNNRVISIKDAIENDLISDKRLSLTNLKNGDTKVEYIIKLKDGSIYNISKGLQSDLNINDSTSQRTIEQFTKLEPYLTGGKIKYDDWLKLRKQGII